MGQVHLQPLSHIRHGWAPSHPAAMVHLPIVRTSLHKTCNYIRLVLVCRLNRSRCLEHYHVRGFLLASRLQRGSVALSYVLFLSCLKTGMYFAPHGRLPRPCEPASFKYGSTPQPRGDRLNPHLSLCGKAAHKVPVPTTVLRIDGVMFSPHAWDSMVVGMSGALSNLYALDRCREAWWTTHDSQKSKCGNRPKLQTEMGAAGRMAFWAA